MRAISRCRLRAGAASAVWSCGMWNGHLITTQWRFCGDGHIADAAAENFLRRCAPRTEAVCRKCGSRRKTALVLMQFCITNLPEVACSYPDSARMILLRNRKQKIPTTDLGSPPALRRREHNYLRAWPRASWDC